ncbi:MAG: ankyrin repeat domain-containing protein [Phycisphaeraceae bacterium]|nr:ankyrin repeat domain-containing protein [Phycisphaeraceae bacterium]
MNNKQMIQIGVVVVCLIVAGIITWISLSGGGSAAKPTPQPMAANRPKFPPPSKPVTPEAGGTRTAKPATTVAPARPASTDPNRQSPDGWPALVEAAYQGNVDDVKSLLQQGAKVDAVGPNGWTALMQAAGNGHADVVRVLLDAKAPLFTENKAKRTAFDIARQRGFDDVCNILLAAGANRDPRPICTAAELSDIPSLTKLLDQGADINMVDGEGQSPLFYSLLENQVHYGQYAHKVKPNVVAFLLEHGAKLTVRNLKQQTPLMMYVCYPQADPEIVSMLLEAGAAVSDTDANGCTPLHRCTSPEVAALLVARGAAITAVDQNGDTPLHRQIACYQADVVKWLIDHGASLTATNKRGQTPAQMLGNPGNLPVDKKRWEETKAVLPAGS